LSLHEFWAYDDEKHTQTLSAIHHLCNLCHKIKHIGFWCHTADGRMKLKQAGLDRDDLIRHFCRVNNCTKQDFQEYEDNAFDVWRERSKHQWEQDFGNYREFIKRARDQVALICHESIALNVGSCHTRNNASGTQCRRPIDASRLAWVIDQFEIMKKYNISTMWFSVTKQANFSDPYDLINQVLTPNALMPIIQQYAVVEDGDGDDDGGSSLNWLLYVGLALMVIIGIVI